MKVKMSELNRVTKKALLHYGYSPEEAEIVQGVLLYAQLRGNNQGISKLIGAGLPRDPDAGKIEMIKETKISALFNGHQNPGMLVLNQAAELVARKASEHGFAIAGTFNTNTSTGAIGYYARKLAEKDLIGFVYAGSRPTVSPFGSSETLYGTNPLAIALPSNRNPVVLDMATAAITFYGLIEAMAAGTPIPEDSAYDADGDPTRDARRVLDGGAIRPFDRGYKGSGLSFMVEALTGPLVAASFAGLGDVDGNWGNLIYAINPDLLVDRSTFKANVSLLVEQLDKVARLPGIEKVYAPGEIDDLLYQERMDSGEIEIEENLYRELLGVIGER